MCRDWKTGKPFFLTGAAQNVHPVRESEENTNMSLKFVSGFLSSLSFAAILHLFFHINLEAYVLILTIFI